MIIVHHLNNSRSQRILWALEELALPYEIRFYERAPVLAPESLKQVHPLGKSPVISDGDLVVHESGAILDYLARTYGEGRLAPASGTTAWVSYLQWLHYAEGSAMLPLMLGLYAKRLGEPAAPIRPRIESEVANHFGYMETALADRPYFVGDSLTMADIALSFPIEIAESRGILKEYPKLHAWVARIHALPAYRSALEKGGTYTVAF